MTTLSDLAAGVVPYPESLVRDYRADGLWGTRTIADELQLTIDT